MYEGRIQLGTAKEVTRFQGLIWSPIPYSIFPGIDIGSDDDDDVNVDQARDNWIGRSSESGDLLNREIFWIGRSSESGDLLNREIFWFWSTDIRLCSL